MSAQAFEAGKYDCVFTVGNSSNHFPAEVTNQTFSFAMTNFKLGAGWQKLSQMADGFSGKYKAEVFPNAIVVTSESESADTKIFALISFKKTNGNWVVHQQMAKAQKASGTEDEVEDFAYYCTKQ